MSKKENKPINTDGVFTSIDELFSCIDNQLAKAGSYNSKVEYLNAIHERLEKSVEESTRMSEDFQNGRYLIRMKSEKRKVDSRLWIDSYFTGISFILDAYFAVKYFNDNITQVTYNGNGMVVSSAFFAFFTALTALRAKQKRTFEKDILEYEIKSRGEEGPRLTMEK